MGYRPSVRLTWLDIGQVIFLCVYRSRRSRERGQYSAMTEQAWSIKDYYMG